MNTKDTTNIHIINCLPNNVKSSICESLLAILYLFYSSSLCDSSIPSTDSALAASRAYATHPHIAGSAEDFSDAKVILELFQNEFNIPTPSNTPIYSAGTPESRNATLSLTRTDAPTIPTAWMDIYYPVLNLPLDRSLSILGSDGKNLWTADLVEDGDPRDPDAHQYKEAVPAFHGLSCDGDVTGQLVYANYGLKEVCRTAGFFSLSPYLRYIGF